MAGRSHVPKPRLASATGAETRATRVFFHAPPPAPQLSAPTAPVPAGEVEITVIDTAGYSSSLAAFADFTPGKSGITEKKLLGSLPTIVTTVEEGRQLSQTLVHSRYIVEITLAHLPSTTHLEDWLRTFHFDALPPKPGAPSPTSPAHAHEFRISHLDELHPEKNRSYFVSTH